jgi:DNA helicase-2/ATP-dependent DNA helicase PcrA
MSALTTLPGLEQLSRPQQAAVLHGEGPLLVISGAGSGKTRTLTYRAARLVRDGCPPEKLLIATFTNRAAAEFRERVTGLLGSHARDIWMGTLHSVGARILRRYGALGGFSQTFQILDGRTALSAVIRACYRLSIDQERAPASAVLSEITRYKERMISPAQVRERISDISPQWEQDVAALYSEYQTFLQQNNLLDFSDLIANCVRLLERAPEVARKLGLWYVLVDEGQDLDPTQWRMIRSLLPPATNLTVVADPDQAIFSWRGADPTTIVNFEQHYPTARVVPLGQNYRCSQTIVAAAAAVIQQNFQRRQHRIWSEKPDSGPILKAYCMSTEAEAEQVAAQIQQLHRELQVPYREMAVLYRANGQSEPFEAALLSRAIPFHVIGARFFEHPEIKDTLNYLRLLHDPADPDALKACINTPARCITRDTVARLKQRAITDRISVWEAMSRVEFMQLSAQAKRGLTQFRDLFGALLNERKKPLPELLERVIIESGLRAHYEKKETDAERTRGLSPLENLDRLVELCRLQYSGAAETDLPELLLYAAALTDDAGSGERDAVQLLTAHASKGEEYRAVFLVGLEDGSFPHWRSLQSENRREALEEERRLFYVAMTRAKELLYLSHAQCKAGKSGTRRADPSRFLDDIPKQYVQRWLPAGG